MALVLLTSLVLCAVFTGCSDGEGYGNGAQGSATSSASPTAAPRDTAAASGILSLFVKAVQENRLDDAWALYAASVNGDTSIHRPERGCDYGAFSFEFPKMQHLFSRIAPLEVIETHGSALGTTVVELTLRGADRAGYLATLARSEPDEEYQLMFLNKGRPAAAPGVPDPLQPPEDPQGFCGIWAGAR